MGNNLNSARGYRADKTTHKNHETLKLY